MTSWGIAKCFLSRSLRVIILVFLVLALAIMAIVLHARSGEGIIKIVAKTGKGTRLLLADPICTEEHVAIDDPMAMQAVETLRTIYNAQRRVTCTATEQYNQPGAIQFAKKLIARNGTLTFAVEVVFGNDSVFARISTRSERNESNGGQKFQIFSSVPGPCEIEPRKQLAVPARGAPR